MKKYVVPGLICVLLGLFLLINTLVDLPGTVFLLVIGLAFLIARVVTGAYGLSIPGWILSCLGLGMTLREYFPVMGQMFPIMLLSLSLAFLMIHITEFRRIGNWPLIPASILCGLGLLMFIASNRAIVEFLRPYLGYILPAVLILLGLVLLIRALIEKRNPPQAAQWSPPAGNAPAPGATRGEYNPYSAQAARAAQQRQAQPVVVQAEPEVVQAEPEAVQAAPEVQAQPEAVQAEPEAVQAEAETTPGNTQDQQ